MEVSKNKPTRNKCSQIDSKLLPKYFAIILSRCKFIPQFIEESHFQFFTVTNLEQKWIMKILKPNSWTKWIDEAKKEDFRWDYEPSNYRKRNL